MLIQCKFINELFIGAHARMSFTRLRRKVVTLKSVLPSDASATTARARGSLPAKTAQAVARRLAIGRWRGGGGARARPPVFPRTMPNGAFVKVSSFTDGGRSRLRRTSADIRHTAFARLAPIEGRDACARAASPHSDLSPFASLYRWIMDLLIYFYINIIFIYIIWILKLS